MYDPAFNLNDYHIATYNCYANKIPVRKVEYDRWPR